MGKINYIIRENGIGETIVSESEFSLFETFELLKDYPYLLESMEKENYYPEDDLCFMFDEIVFENKVVGFAACELRFDDTFIMNECYIMPEYRKKGLFYDEVCKLNYMTPKFGILMPPENVVKLLIKYDLAEMVSDDIAVSAIDFYFDYIYAKSNIKEEYGEEELPATNFYDFRIHSAIYAEIGEVFYHDMASYDVSGKYSDIDLTDEYFTTVCDLFAENSEEFEDLIAELKSELPQDSVTYEDIVGSGEELSEFMENLIEDDIISYDDALDIKAQLITEYENGEIDDENISYRASELIGFKSPITKDINGFRNFINTLPDDDEDVQAMKMFLDIIGDDEEMGGHLLNAILTEDEDEFERIMKNKIEGDDEFLENLISVSESVDDDDEYLDLSELFADDSNNPLAGLNPNSPYPVAEMMWGRDTSKYRLDDTFYGKDYPISHDIYLYRVLNSIKRHNNLKLAMATADIDGAMTSQLIETVLFDGNFLNNEVTYDNWDEFADEFLTVNDLKDILRQNKLKVSGRKQELIDRIRENNISLDEFKTPKVTVTSTGEEFLEDNKWIETYDKVLDKFDFNDFSKYLDENEGEFLDVTQNYIKEHIKHAQELEDEQYLTDCHIAQFMIDAMTGKIFKYDNT